MIEFTVWGEPRGKDRPKASTRGGHTTIYTPRATSEYEAKVKQAYRNEYGGYTAFPKGTPVAVSITAYYRIPKEAKYIREAMQQGVISPVKKPDCDNIIKIICDALNGAAYYDDAQVVAVECKKAYDVIPRVEVRLTRGGMISKDEYKMQRKEKTCTV